MLKHIALIGFISLGFYKNIFAVNEQIQEIAFYRVMHDVKEKTIQYVHQQNQDTQDSNKITNKYHIGIVNKNNISNIEDKVILPIDGTECIIEEINNFYPEVTNRLPIYFDLIAYILNSDFNSKLFSINDINEKNTFAAAFLYEVSQKQIYFQNHNMLSGSMDHHSLAIENEGEFQMQSFKLLLCRLFADFIESPDSIKLILSQLLGSYKISFIDKSIQHNNEFIEYDSLMDQRVVNIYGLLNLTKQECTKAGISDFAMYRIQQQILDVLKELAIPVFFIEALTSANTPNILPVAILTGSRVSLGSITCDLNFIKKEKQHILYEYLATNINNIKLKQIQNSNNDNAYDESDLFCRAKYFFLKNAFFKPALYFPYKNHPLHFVTDLNLFEKLAIIENKKFTNLSLNLIKCMLCNTITPKDESISFSGQDKESICIRCFEGQDTNFTTNNNHAGINNGVVVGAGATEPALRTTEAGYNNSISANRSTNHELNLNKCISCKKNTAIDEVVILNEQINQTICLRCFEGQDTNFTANNNHAGINNGVVAGAGATEPALRATEARYNRISINRSTNQELNLSKCISCDTSTPKDKLVILNEQTNQSICLRCYADQDTDLKNNNHAGINNGVVAGAGATEPALRATEARYNRISINRSTNQELNLSKCMSCDTSTPKDKLVILNEQTNQSICLYCFSNQDTDLTTNSSFNIAEDRAKKDEKCPICFEYIISNKVVPINCGHLFHQKCLSRWGWNKVCPVCRK